MFRLLVRWAAFAFLILPVSVAAEPVKLKLAFHTSDRSNIYQAAVKPFVDAVNAAGQGLVEIDVHFSGALGATPVLQWEALRDGTADIAFVIPGQISGQFPDTAMIELPGLYRNMREATLVFTRLVASGVLKDYRDYFVIGAFAVEPENIHTRPPVASLDDLRGKKIRVNNPTLSVALAKLGMAGVVMPVNLAAEAISSGKIDGAAVPVSPLFEFGIGRVATYHYLLPLDSAPLVLLMKRKTFDRLPKQAQDIVRRYSGEWAAERFIETFEAINTRLIAQLESDPRQKVISPSQPDMDKASAAFAATAADIVGGNPHRQEILILARSELAKLRSEK
jgi:TRAP-type C4-dicarboxylate transport system substrate-binding protein